MSYLYVKIENDNELFILYNDDHHVVNFFTPQYYDTDHFIVNFSHHCIYHYHYYFFCFSYWFYYCKLNFYFKYNFNLII